MKVEKLSDIIIHIEYPEHSRNEIMEVDIIFGLKIIIIYNQSYISMTNEKRVEETKVIEIHKSNNVSPSILTDDVFILLSDTLDKFQEEMELESLLQLIVANIENIQILY